MITQFNRKGQINLKVFILERLLHLQYFVSLQKMMFYFISILGDFQGITFLWVPIFESQKLTFFQNKINYESFIIYLSRIDELINFQFNASLQYYLIPLLIQILLFFIPLLILIYQQKRERILKLTIVNFYIKISSIFFQTFVTYLYVPFTVLCTQTLLITLSQNQSIFHLIFATFSLLLTFIILIINLVLNRETIDLKVNRFQKFNQTFLDYLQVILQILQIFVYGIIKSEINGQTLQGVLVLTMSFINIVQVFQFEYTDVLRTKFSLMISSFGCVASIYSLIQNLQQDLIYKFTNTGIIMVYITLSKLLLIFYSQREESIQNNILLIKQHKIIKYYLSRLVTDDLSKSEKRINHSILLHQMSKIFEQHSNDSEVKQTDITILTSQNLDVFVQKKLKQYVKCISQIKGIDLHYVALLYSFGFSNIALIQINSLINKQLIQTKYKGFLGDGDAPSSILDSSQKYAAHQSVSSKSLRSNTDEINDMAKRAQFKKSKLLMIGNYQLSSLNTARALFLKNQIKENLQFRFYENNNTKSQLNDMKQGVELFLKNEKRNQGLKNTMIKLINEKVSFTLQFTTKKAIDADQLYNKAIKLSKIQQSLEDKLFIRYQQFPSLKIQSILVFYQGEILNNFIEAHKYKNLTSMPEEQLINMDVSIKTAFFSKKVVYLNIQLEYNQNLLITSKSENSLKFFQISQEDQKHFTNVDYLLPLAIKNEHSLLVQRFTQTSKSKFYLNSSQTFFKLNNLLIKSCQLLFDIHFDNINHYKFSAFFSESINQSAYLLVDINQKLGGITESFFEKLGLNEEYYNQFNMQESTQLQIDYLIPNFKKLIESKQQNTITELRFLKEAYLLESYGEKLRNQTRQQSLTSTHWSNLDQTYIFEAEICIQYHDIFGYNYFIIEIKDVKQLINSKRSQVSSRNKKVEGLEEFFELSELSEVEAVAQSPKISRQQNKFKICYDENMDENKMIAKIAQELEEKQKADKQQQLEQSQQKQEISFQQNILSPNFSNAPWQDQSQIPLQIQQSMQQDYFHKDNSDDKSFSLYQSKNIKLEELEDEFKSRIEKQKVAARQNKDVVGEKEQSSSNNALKGIKKSIFYKKYETIFQLIGPITPTTLKLFIMFQELTYIIALTYFIIILGSAQVDLNRFIGEIDMIQLHAGIMNPHDLYLQIRQPIITYNSFLVAGKITQAEFKELTDPLYENVGIGYYEFKEGFIYWLGNEYLTPFLKDKNITVYYMLYNGSKTYPITQNIREALMATLSYYYDFKLRFEARLSTANQTYQVYQFANIYNFHFWLEDVTMEVYQYSKNRSIDISNKWNMIWIIYLMVNICPLFASLFYYRLFNSKFDQLVSLFKYCSSYRMELELERLKYILKVLNKNSDLLFNYQFNIEQKEEDIFKLRQEHEQQKVKDIKIQQQFKKISFGIKFIVVILGWMIFFALSLVSNIQIGEYLNKYSATADAYKLIQDMSLYAGTLYRNRDFGLAFANYPYLRPFDTEKFYYTINTGLETISKFLQFSYTFDSSQYQTSEDFFKFFQSLQEQNICIVLGDENLGFLKQYCEKSLQGSLLLGLFPTLKFISNQISNQMMINNFTKRVEFNKYENEGSIIVLRAFQLMSKQFKIGMVNVTEQQITICNTISIIFIVYSLLLMSYLLFILLQKLRIELNLARRFILLIPSTVLFLDDQFDRHVRILIAGQDY
ncbi:unnamed protein product (macronuclear) [Paramecium tetraurelia]|uniref:Transmembrane protein n=1 Tax=Paramecium tetraurelia TaxID=5888 RepID=A0BZP8_PARTE|nr:uncharacterized protein GSPATT00005867001 [Paramecium tetraurelia]CAK64015.1 unnamed protein product [Paramecium tetraurelia]|eukprot:XP_001431413.1 hypothetical protein (macronuclear) [Paramecium tetraurelia strain d4-2]